VDQHTLTIGQACQAAGVTRKAVRVYEAKGLLPRAARTAAGYRLFSAEDVGTLRFIRRARGLGLRLDEVAGVLAEWRAGGSPCPSARARLEEHITDVEDAIAELQQLREALISAAGRSDSPSDQDLICPIIERERT